MESPPVDSPPLLLPMAAAAAFAAACKADSPILTGTTTGELLPAAESNDGVLLLEVVLPAVEFAADDCSADGRIGGGIEPTSEGSPSRCAVDERNGAASGNNDESAAPFSPPS